MCKILILAFVFLLFSCNASTKKKGMTVREFTETYFDSLKTRFPKTKFSIVDDSTILAKFPDYDIKISSDNAYKEYKMEPDSICEVLSRYVLVTSEAVNPTTKLDANQIIPIVKPIEFLEGIKTVGEELGAKENFDGVHEKYNDQLIIAYAHDSKTNIDYLTNDDLKTLGINRDSLRVIAIRNLDRILNIQLQGSQGTYMLTAGGNFETSIILLQNLFTKENLPVNGEYVIAIPNRDLLLVTGSNDKDGISKLREMAIKSFETGNYQVSQYLYKWNGKRFERYE